MKVRRRWQLEENPNSVGGTRGRKGRSRSADPDCYSYFAATKRVAPDISLSLPPINGGPRKHDFSLRSRSTYYVAVKGGGG